MEVRGELFLEAYIKAPAFHSQLLQTAQAARRETREATAAARKQWQNNVSRPMKLQKEVEVAWAMGWGVKIKMCVFVLFFGGVTASPQRSFHVVFTWRRLHREHWCRGESSAPSTHLISLHVVVFLVKIKLHFTLFFHTINITFTV